MAQTNTKKKERKIPAWLDQIKDEDPKRFRELCSKGGKASIAKLLRHNEEQRILESLRREKLEKELYELKVATNEIILPFDPEDIGDEK